MITAAAPDRKWMRPNNRPRNKYKMMPESMKTALGDEIKMMLHAHRDCLRNRGEDYRRIPFDCRDGWYGEAFGIIRALAVLGYGKLGGAINIDSPGNLNYWFHELSDQVLNEENFRGNHECDHCLSRYGKDGAGRKRSAE